MNIGNKLKVFSSKNERTRCLVDELCKINVNLPARVWLPLYAHSLKHIVLRIPPLAGCILNSKDKVSQILKISYGYTLRSDHSLVVSMLLDLLYISFRSKRFRSYLFLIHYDESLGPVLFICGSA